MPLLVQFIKLTLGSRVYDYMREIDSLSDRTKNQAVPSTDSTK